MLLERAALCCEQVSCQSEKRAVDPEFAPRPGTRVGGSDRFWNLLRLLTCAASFVLALCQTSRAACVTCDVITSMAASKGHLPQYLEVCDANPKYAIADYQLVDLTQWQYSGVPGEWSHLRWYDSYLVAALCSGNDETSETVENVAVLSVPEYRPVTLPTVVQPANELVWGAKHRPWRVVSPGIAGTIYDRNMNAIEGADVGGKNVWSLTWDGEVSRKAVVMYWGGGSRVHDLVSSTSIALPREIDGWSVVTWEWTCAGWLVGIGCKYADKFQEGDKCDDLGVLSAINVGDLCSGLARHHGRGCTGRDHWQYEGRICCFARV